MRRHVELIGAAWGLGGADAGCAAAPAVLAPRLVERLGRCAIPLHPGPMLAPVRHERRRQLALSRLSAWLASAVANAIRSGRLPCVLGGDHSCAVGTWTGAARAVDGPLGLVWIDAHMDSHTPATSPSGRWHGMPLAWLLGQDDDPLYGLATGVLDPRHVALIGVRSFEPEEEALLRQLAVRVMHIDEVERRGLASAFDEALAIASAGTAGFGVSIDLDALAPDEAPGVGTPVPGGLRGRDLARAMQTVHGRADLVALELAEFSPPRDRNNATADAAVAMLAAALCGASDDAQVLAHAIERHDA